MMTEDIKINTLRDALREGLQSCGLWEIRLKSRQTPITLETPADVYLKGARPWAYLVVISCEDVGRHFDQFFGLSGRFVIPEGENISTYPTIAPEDAPEGADALDRPDDDDYDNTDGDEEDDGDDSIMYVEPTPEQYEAWAIDIFNKLILPRCSAMALVGTLIPPDNGN